MPLSSRLLHAVLLKHESQREVLPGYPRRKSISGRSRSQSALFRSRAAIAAAASKLRNRASWLPDGLRRSDRSASTGKDRPLGALAAGVTDHAGPPPISTIGVCPNRCSQAAPITGIRLPTCSESEVGIEARHRR